MSKKFFTAGLLGLSLAVSSVSAEDQAVATVNGEPIKQSTLEALTDVMKRSRRSGNVDNNVALEDLISTEVVRQEAQKSGLAEREDIKKQIQEFEDRLVLNAWSSEKLKSFEISDEELQKAYDESTEGHARNEYKARHILLPSKEEAEAVIVELNNGADFVELAKTKSTGPSAPKGGDLGWFASKTMVPPFAQAVQSMEKGSISKEPVATDFGFHVILLEDIRDTKLPDPSVVKPQLKRVLQQKKLKAYVQELREKADVKINLEVLKELGEDASSQGDSDDKSSDKDKK